MCFSAGASFTAAAGLSLISLAAIKKTRNANLCVIAASPLFFAIQQACEGVVWLTLNAGDTTSFLHTCAMHSFLFFAVSWWPFWIPYALYTVEKIPHRKKLLFLLSVIGTIVAIILFFRWNMLTSGVEIVNHHLNYPVEHYPFDTTNETYAFVASWIISLCYCVATVAPLFISSLLYMWVLGIIMSISLIVSYVFYAMALPSVWCFFAAVGSMMIYGIVTKNIQKIT